MQQEDGTIHSDSESEFEGWAADTETDSDTSNEQCNEEQLQRGREREHLYAQREMHIESLKRFFNEINDPERFRALDQDDLVLRQGRLKQHFSDMERAHRQYRQICILASDDIYEQEEAKLLQAMAKISHESLSTIVDALNNSQRRLQAICPHPTNPLLDQVWINLAKQRLPKRTLDSWEQQRNRDGANGLPSGESFRKFLETKARGRREFEQPEVPRSKHPAGGGKTQRESSNRFRPYENNRNRDNSYSNRDRSHQNNRNEFKETNNTIECVVPTCKQKHQAWMCDAFFKMSLTDRRNLIRDKRLCSTCLSSGHLSFSCTRPAMACKKCPEAPYKHHYKMCSKAVTSDQSTTAVVKRGAEATRR